MAQLADKSKITQLPNGNFMYIPADGSDPEEISKDELKKKYGVNPPTPKKKKVTVTTPEPAAPKRGLLGNLLGRKKRDTEGIF